MRRLFASAFALALSSNFLAGCAVAPPPTPPASPVLGMYQNLAAPEARIDAETAAEMIAAYRRKHGMKPLVLDPALMSLAESEAGSMAASARPTSADGITAKAAAAGFSGPAANLSAGYQTWAEAFSGWRESTGHNAVMLDPRADRMGIATAYAPGTKYRVFWAMIVAQHPTR